MFEFGQTVKIKSYRWEYELRYVSILPSVLQSELRESDVLFVDENVARLHDEVLKGALNEHKHQLIKPSEQQKSYQQLESIIEWLIQTGFKKNHRLVAIGGGITQDICAFIASIIYRGVEWLFIPTSLLSQCDSCIGSKTSINFGQYKNQIGNFYPPVLIFLDDRFLKTLTREEIRSGMGEMMHYFLIAGHDDMMRISNDYDAAFKEPQVLSGLIQRSLDFKKTMIELDEFDSGPRNIFNYGHSFGHALESYSNYIIPHGVAVSFGMDIANELSLRLGIMHEKETMAMREVLRKNWWPCDFPAIDIEAYLRILGKDKKNIGSTLRFVLSRGPGDMFLSTVRNDATLREVLIERFEYYVSEAKRYETR